MKRSMKKAPTRNKPAARRTAKTAARPPAAKRRLARADFGAPIEGFFARQPPHLRTILEELRSLVEAAAPDAEGSIKWGMPFYSVRGAMMCALGAHKAHVNLVLSGPADAFPDPDGRLEGASANGRHLKLTALAELPTQQVRGWLRTAAELARGKG